MSALNNLLKDTSGSASTHFHNFIEENFKDEIERELSPDEVKEIEEQARENINKRNDIPLEQKEEEYEKENFCVWDHVVDDQHLSLIHI